jgi:hypothetical protein
MDVDGQQTRDGATFAQDDEEWLSISELSAQSLIRYIERRLPEARTEQARPGSLEASGTVVARMMAAMGYVPGLTLCKNGHRIVPPPNSQSRLGVDADQAFEESILSILD